MVNTYDVHFYGSWALIMLFPLLDLSLQADFCNSTLMTHAIEWKTLHSGYFLSFFSLFLFSLSFLSFLLILFSLFPFFTQILLVQCRDKAIRKVKGAVPHDLGNPGDDPWTMVNSYCIQVFFFFVFIILTFPVFLCSLFSLFSFFLAKKFQSPGN